MARKSQKGLMPRTVECKVRSDDQEGLNVRSIAMKGLLKNLMARKG
jgi:hypothetical protein